MENLMVDLETLGTSSNAAIIAIGAVFFDETHVGQTFYMNIDIEKARGDISLSTIKWWLKQDAASRKSITQDGNSELLTLMEFQTFCTANCNKKTLKLWGNGASFDNVILRSALERNRLLVPWEYWNDRCYRTYKAVNKAVTEDAFKGTRHNALSDALHQAKHMIHIAQTRLKAK